jgi:hypothetical protein
MVKFAFSANQSLQPLQLKSVLVFKNFSIFSNMADAQYHTNNVPYQ